MGIIKDKAAVEPENNSGTASKYKTDVEEASGNLESFWKSKALKYCAWDTQFSTVLSGKFGSCTWFSGGTLNACYNCLDRWVEKHPDKIAFIFSSNDGASSSFTYREALKNVMAICTQLSHLVPGDCVSLYLSMSSFAVFTMLACCRLGIVHNVVFGGYSAESLRLRLIDSNSKLLITQNAASRGDKHLDFLGTVHTAVNGLGIEVLINTDTGLPLSFENANLEEFYKTCRRWPEMAPKSDVYIPPIPVVSGHPLFYLYTSGSTGLPKGLIHSTAGYLVYVAYSLEMAFDIRSTDIFCCTADIGWITGHSYCVYGPMLLGITSVIMEGLPSYPDHYRFFRMITDYKITQLYTAPTVVRMLKEYGDIQPLDLKGFSLGSLRYLGTVGEPISADAHAFFSKVFSTPSVVDTYFQTETGGIMIAPIPNVSRGKPGCASLPIPGIFPVIRSSENAEEPDEDKRLPRNTLGKVFIEKPWPGLSLGILNDQARFTNGYFSAGIYYTGDEGMQDDDGDFWIMGRADDVINMSGHRISTAEVENAAASNPLVSEAAVVAVDDEIKGQNMVLFVVLNAEDKMYEKKINHTISKKIGAFCRPKYVIASPGIPKTRTMKLMRRILRLILMGKTDFGDISTCVNKEVIPLIQAICASRGIVCKKIE